MTAAPEGAGADDLDDATEVSISARPLADALSTSPTLAEVAGFLGEAPEYPVQDWDRYEFLGFLGQGGMGQVFLAQDRRLQRLAAVKFVRLDKDTYIERFMIEARAQAQVDHEHVCKVYEVGSVAGKVFIAMQYIAGSALDRLAPVMTLEQKVLVLRDAARGVHEAHRAGIIHRDIKPSNIMVEQTEDGALRTFVMDFGLAKERDQDLTETGSALGTPMFMSPEQARGEVSGMDRRADVYSLGATLYQVATGHAPFPGANALEILSSISTQEVLPLRSHCPDIPRDLEAITLKCMEKDRALRYDSAKSFADDLERYLGGEPVLARPTGLWYRLQRRMRKHKQVTATLAAALALVLLASGIALKSRRDAGRRERLSRQFTEAIDRIDSTARYSALAPLHDIRPDLQDMRAEMARIAAAMKAAGDIANGPGHYALGRGYWTLDDLGQAREHLQLGWDAGYREPRAAYALAVVLGRQYQERLLEAERITAKDQREARLQAIATELREPALRMLRRARGSDVPSPAYLEALLACYEGRQEEALDRLKTMEQNRPWFYEGPLLRGGLLQARAWSRWNAGDREGAKADFEAGRRDLATAAASGRSAPAVQVAMADLELNAFYMEKYGQGQVQPAFDRGMAALQLALTAQPDHVPALALQSSLLGEMASFEVLQGRDGETLAQRATTTAESAVAAGPTRAEAWKALGRACYQWANARGAKSLDPTDAIVRGLRAFDALSQEKRDYTVWNMAGALHEALAKYQNAQDRDASAEHSKAIAAFETATRMEPQLLNAWINLGSCLLERSQLPQASAPDVDLQSASKALDQARALNPKNFVPCFVLGQVRYCQALRTRNRGGDPRPELNASLELNQVGLAISPSIPQLHIGVGLAASELARTAWEEGEDPSQWISQAQAAYLHVIEVAPQQSFGYKNLVTLLIWQGRILNRTSALSEAQAILHKGSRWIPEAKVWIHQAHVDVARAQLALADDTDPSPSLSAAEAALNKALARLPNDGQALQFLGELRAARASWRLRRHQADAESFEQAATPFRQALASDPDNQEAQLDLARLLLARASWERTRRQDTSTSLAQAHATLDPLLQKRPRWGEALTLRCALALEEAEGMPPAQRKAKIAATVQDLHTVLRQDRNLAEACKRLENQAERVARSES